MPLSEMGLTHLLGYRFLPPSLLKLAPDILEAILYLPKVESGRESITERHLRPAVELVAWREQRWMWTLICGGE